jgi:hypothetical protein
MDRGTELFPSRVETRAPHDMILKEVVLSNQQTSHGPNRTMTSSLLVHLKYTSMSPHEPPNTLPLLIQENIHCYRIDRSVPSSLHTQRKICGLWHLGSEKYVWHEEVSRLEQRCR